MTVGLISFGVSLFADGAANAPAGTAQYPTRLNGYTTKPPWRVAGVDYAVGPNGTPSSDPASAPAGTTYNATGASNGTPQLTITSNNVTLDGYDFTLHNGVSVSCPSNTNLTIQNCKFGGTNYAGLSTGPIDFRSNTLTLKYNTIDGGATGGADTQATLVYLGTNIAGTVTLQYNWFKNYPQQVVEFGNSSGTVTINYRFNLIDECHVETGGHMNCLQFDPSTGTYAPTVAFNTLKQSLAGGAEGFQFYSTNTTTLVSPNFSNNTCMAITTGCMSNIIHGSVLAGTTTLSGTATNTQNYFDITGATLAYYPGSMTTGWTSSGNINMSTGAAITPS